MSTVYTAEQYDQEFTPKRLGMYELPKEKLSSQPKTFNGTTQVIANDKGHLLAGTKKGDTNPFGDFVGTWDLPKSIPGPYHLNPTARSNKNLEKLQEKRANTDKEIKQAIEEQKPVSLKKTSACKNSSKIQTTKIDEKYNKLFTQSPNQDDAHPFDDQLLSDRSDEHH